MYSFQRAVCLKVRWKEYILERVHFTLTEYLRHYVNLDTNDWDNWFHYAVFCFNTNPHSATLYMPSQLVFGRNSSIPTSISETREIFYNCDDFISELKNLFQRSLKLA